MVPLMWTAEQEQEEEWLWGTDRQRATAVVRVLVVTTPENSCFEEEEKSGCETTTEDEDEESSKKTSSILVSNDKLASCLTKTTWTEARDMRWYSTRLRHDHKGMVRGLDASLSLMCTPGEEDRLCSYLQSKLVEQFPILSSKDDDNNHDVLDVEVLLTAPGYMPMMERRYNKLDEDVAWTDRETFDEMGLAVLCNQPVDANELTEIRNNVMRYISEIEELFATHHKGINFGKDPFLFSEIGSRGGERYDALVDLNDPRWEELDLLARESAPWLGPINILLDGEWNVAVSVVFSRPGAEHQGWHCDGRHLGAEADFDGRGHERTYGVCVFMPLIDLNDEVGFTQFFLKSHKTSKLVGFGEASHLLEADFDGVLNAGQSVLYDYRLMHRGMANKSKLVRPVLQFLYTKPFYKETKNYGVESMYATP